MAREGISRAQVFDAADAISRAGQAPTVAGVRAKLGTGSYTTITAMLRDWKEQSIDQEGSEEIDVPEAITEALGRAAEIVWKAATDHFSNELAAVRKASDKAVNQAQEATEEATAEIERLERELQEHADQEDDSKKQIEALELKIKKMQQGAAESSAELSELKACVKAYEARIKEQGELLRRLVPEKKTRTARKEPTKQASVTE